MRQIKFRGLRKFTEYEKGFKYGHLLNECSIGEVGIGLASYCYAEVIPETVGQFTGLKDKNGVEIYEGDVVKTTNCIGQIKYEVQGCLYLMKWTDKENKHRYRELKATEGSTEYSCSWIEVIGNIHENKNLIR